MIRARSTREPVPGYGRSVARASKRAASGALLAASVLLSAVSPVAAADLTVEARALLGGNVRLGAWAAVEVDITNDGPAISGELRLAGDRQGRSSYGVEVDLPTGSRKRFVLYAQPAIFRTKLEVALVSGGQAIATTSVPIKVNDPYAAVVGVLAERPQAIVPDIASASGSLRGNRPAIATLTVADLPPRVEAWGGIDRLVWQDLDASQLSKEQADALSAWVAAGGRLVIVGGTTGTSTLGGFPEQLLPFRPVTTIDVPRSDLAAFLGGSSGSGTGTVPALTGPLDHGKALVTSAGSVVAAEASYGQGNVTLIGFDPGHTDLAGGSAIQGLWRRIMPATTNPVVSPLALPDDSQLVAALANIPSADLPPLGPLLFLLVAYIVVVGPLNYLLLRRLDRREWAWLTMPAIVLVFAGGSYGMGTLLKGGEIIVNEVGIVRSGLDTEHGLAQVYVGVFSPSRQRYEVRVGGGALLSNPVSLEQSGGVQQPLDVLLGPETSRLRGYQVGFGALRGFRAESPVTAPRVKSDLRFENGSLVGTITNDSDTVLEAAAVVFGDSVAVVGDLAPGKTTNVSMKVSSQVVFGLPLSERLYGASFTSAFDAETERTRYTRRTVIDVLSGYGKNDWGGFGQIASNGPMLLAWRSVPTIPVELADQRARAMGQTLYMTELPTVITGQTSFPTGLMRRSVLASDAAEATDQGMAFSLTRGSMTVDFRPIAFEGRLVVSNLLLVLTQGEGLIPRQPDGDPVGPLPDDQQPPQDDPVGTTVDATASPEPLPSGGEPSGGPAFAPGIQQPRFDGLPEIQLFDRTTGRWMEFAHLEPGKAVAIAQPERYVDEAGSLLVRFVNRGPQEGVYFTLNLTTQGEVVR